MPKASEARAWAHSALHGIGDSLYTPFCGVDGDDIDWDAYRALVRYCVGDLGHSMLWLTSGVGEFWSLTIPERKRLLETAIEEARVINPDVVIQSCTAALSAKDCLELTLHAQDAGADIAYIQTPMMELHGGEGVLKFFRYISDRTDIALGMFNSPSSGYVLSAAESARIVEAMDFAVESGLDRFGVDMMSWFTCYPGRPDYFTHWGGAFKYAASVLGLPIGDYPHSRPPQAELPAAAQQQIRAAYRRLGLIG